MEDNLSKARALVLQYREYVRAQQIDNILDSLSQDASIQVPGTPPLSGKSAIRQFYENRFLTGDYTFEIEVTHEKEVSDLIFINGIMTRIIIREASTQETRVLDFSFILKNEEDQLKIWQIRVV